MSALHDRRVGPLGAFGAVAALACGCLGIGVGAPSASAQTETDWSSYLDGPTHSSYNPAATSITPSNISSLEPVWRWMPPPPPNDDGGSTELLASPSVYDGVVYIGVEDGYFYAISEATQQVLWSQFLGFRPHLTCGTQVGGTVSTATIAADSTTGAATVFVFGQDGDLYALNAATGAVDWQSVVDTPSPTKSNYYSWSSPVVANDTVYIGVSSQCDHPLVPAGVASFNQSTGAPIARWWTLGNDKSLGGSVWSSVSVLSNGNVIATTGNAKAPGQQPYSQSIVELNGQTLSLMGGWEVPTAQAVTDSDFGASPTQFTADLDGTPTLMIGACNKNGIYYALRASDPSAGPVWEDQIVQSSSFGKPPGECDAAAIWDGTHLIEGGGNWTTVDGTSYPGSVVSLNPDTGEVVWQTGLPGFVIGSPTEDGAGVVAAQTFYSPTAQQGVYLLTATTGAVLGSIVLPNAPLFGQPVWDGNDLLVPGSANVGLTAYEITGAGPSISVAPDSLAQHRSVTVTIKGSGFTGQPTAFFSGSGIQVNSTRLVSATRLKVYIAVLKGALPGAYDVAVIEPGSPDIADTCEACFTVTASG